MSTYMANPQNVERNWYVLDAEGKTLGALAVEAAVLLRGKHKVTFTPHVDCGDNVIIINSSKVVLKRPWNPEGLEPETIIQMLRSLKKEG